LQLQRFRYHPARHPVALAFLHELEEDRLAALPNQLASVDLHLAATGVRLQAPAPATASAPATGFDDDMADLARSPATLVKVAVDEQAATPAGADEHAA